MLKPALYMKDIKIDEIAVEYQSYWKKGMSSVDPLKINCNGKTKTVEMGSGGIVYKRGGKYYGDYICFLKSHSQTMKQAAEFAKNNMPSVENFKPWIDLDKEGDAMYLIGKP